ncbi:MAG TPA: POTRA domain-containing protein, partial [Methylotenera sp.]|nr:POTRA domain-containing protein [Methylotenera sp.]
MAIKNLTLSKKLKTLGLKTDPKYNKFENLKLKSILLLVSSLYATSAFALDPFVVKDIRVEGLQRTEPGTVFTYLPVKVGETMNEDLASQAIKSLYGTGFFKDVRIEAEGDVLVVTVQERSSVA